MTLGSMAAALGRVEEIVKEIPVMKENTEALWNNVGR